MYVPTFDYYLCFPSTVICVCLFKFILFMFFLAAPIRKGIIVPCLAKNRNKFRSIQFISKIAITIGVLITTSIWSLSMIWHLDELMTPIYITSNIGILTAINTVTPIVCLFCIASVFITRYQMRLVPSTQRRWIHESKMQVTCLIVILAVSIFWEFCNYGLFGLNLSTNVAMFSFLVYQWLMIFCLGYSFLILPIKTKRKDANKETKSKIKSPTFTQILENEIGLDLWMAKARRELSIGM